MSAEEHMTEDETTAEPHNKREDRSIDICDDCGRAFVGWHRCDDKSKRRGGGTTRELRETLSSFDDNSADDTVVYLPGRADSAYHRPKQARDADGNFVEGYEPQCDAEIKATEGPNGKPRTWETTDRGTARDQSARFPCRQCHDLDDEQT